MQVEREARLVREAAGRKQADVLVEHIAVDELLLEPDVHIDEPPRRHRRDDRQPEHPVQTEQPASQVGRAGHQQHHRQAAEHERERTLGLHAEPDRHVAQPLQARTVAKRGHSEARGAAEREHGEQRIQDRVARQAEHAGARRKHQRGDDPGVTRDHDDPEPPRDRHQPERGQRGHQTRAEFGVADEPHRDALELVEQNWLIEKWLVVVKRCGPVGSRDHLARRFGVMRLIRIPEGRSAEAPEKNDEDECNGENGECRVGRGNLWHLTNRGDTLGSRAKLNTIPLPCPHRGRR